VGDLYIVQKAVIPLTAQTTANRPQKQQQTKTTQTKNKTNQTKQTNKKTTPTGMTGYQFIGGFMQEATTLCHLLMNYLLLQTIQPHVKITHRLIQTRRYYLGYLGHLRSGENFLLSCWTSWHTTSSFRRGHTVQLPFQTNLVRPPASSCHACLGQASVSLGASRMPPNLLHHGSQNRIQKTSKNVAARKGPRLYAS